MPHKQFGGGKKTAQSALTIPCGKNFGITNSSWYS